MLKAALCIAAAASCVSAAPHQASGMTGVRGSLAFAPSLLPLGRSQHTWSVSPALVHVNGLLHNPPPRNPAAPLIATATAKSLSPSNLPVPCLHPCATSPCTPAHELASIPGSRAGLARTLLVPTFSRAEKFSRSRPPDANSNSVNAATKKNKAPAKVRTPASP